MKNESVQDMLSEFRGSRSKTIFFLILVIIGGIAGAAQISELFKPSDPISASYDDVMEDIYLSGLSTAQQDARKDRYKGSYVRWRGKVIDAKKDGWGYSVSVGTSTTAILDVVLTGLSEEGALKLKPRGSIRFTGKISDIKDATITGYVYLDNVTIE